MLIIWYGEVRSSSKRFIWIDLAHVHTCKKTKNTVYYALKVSCVLELKNLSYVLFIKYFVAKHDYDSNAQIWSLSHLLLASTCTGCNGPSVHPNSLSQSIPVESTISTYAWYFLSFQVNLSCATFKIFKILLLCLCF